MPLFEQQNAIREKQRNKTNLAIGLGNLASHNRDLGALWAAEDNLRRRIALCRKIENEFKEAIGHQELGRLLACRGADAESEVELATALRMLERQNHVQAKGLGWAHRTLSELLRLRSASQAAIRDPQSAVASARRALELADEKARTSTPNERDYVRAHWLLGAAHRVAGEHGEAERHLEKALERCRRINMVDHEANILIDLARLRAPSTGSGPSALPPDERQRRLAEARRLAEEALVITERSGYVLQGADAHLELSRLARDQGDNTAALHHAAEARRLATCDGPPDYTYKAAYDEAGTLLAELNSL